MDAIFSNGNNRFGPMPSVEFQAHMRGIVSRLVSAGKPIPFVTVSGGVKPSKNRTVDVAELMALRMIESLYKRIKEIYDPGAVFNMRFEDTTAFAIIPEFSEEAKHYAPDMEKLIRIMGYSFINPLRESNMHSVEDFIDETNAMFPLMYRYLRETHGVAEGDPLHPAMKQLMEFGWKGLLPMVQREFYYSRYGVWYNDKDFDHHIQTLARYMSANLVRTRLRMIGNDPDWGKDFLQLSFMPPIPRVPTELTQNRIFYRSINGKLSLDHKPYWRARGILRVGNNVVKPLLLGWHDQTPELIAIPVTFNGNGESHTMNIEYTIVE